MTNITLKNAAFLTKEDSNPIIQIYRQAAEFLGVDYDTTKGTFDCTKILVSGDIADMALAILSDQTGGEGAGMAWVMYGPKADDNLPPLTIALEDGFFKE